MRKTHFTCFYILAVFLLIRSADDTSAALVSNWKLDDGTGSVAADAAGSNGGTLVSSPAWVSGALGGALSFSAANAVRVPNASSLNPASITVAAWIKTTDGGKAKGIVDKVTGTPALSGYWLDIGETGFQGRPRFGIRNGSANAVTVTNPTSVADGVWHLVTGVFADTGTVKTISLYIDGLHKASSTTMAAMKADVTDLYIAGDGASTLYLNGMIDDVAIWNSPLSATELNSLYWLGLIGGLRYDASEAQRFWDFFATAGVGSNRVVGARTWAYTTGLATPAGEVAFTNGYYRLRLDGSGNGVQSLAGLGTSRWSLDEGAGQVVNDTLYLDSGNLGATQAAAESSDPTWTVDAKFGGQALSFDGGDYVRVPNSARLNPPSLTVSAWVKTSDTGYARGVVDKNVGGPTDTGYWLDIGFPGAGRPRFGMRNGTGNAETATGPVSVADGQWNLMTGVFQGGGVTNYAKLYVNGVLVDTTATTNSIKTDTDPFFIGGDGASTHFLTGTIDDVSLWSFAISDVAAKALYTLGNTAGLQYDSAKVDLLLALYQNEGGSVTIDGKTWTYFPEGVRGVPGEVFNWGDGDFGVNFGGGAGVSTLPTPRATVILITRIWDQLAGFWRAWS